MKKLIFSRKGFDSGSGGTANPILPDGSLLSLPIPDSQAPVSYSQIWGPTGNLGDLVTQLTRGKIVPTQGAHLDPDLDRNALPRSPQWRPLFGQHGAAQGHLRKEGVAPGDVFLFFGWFKPIERTAKGFAFQKGTPDRHIFYGWFQIDAIRDLNETMPRKGSWQADHPHCFGNRGANNTLYIASKRLHLPGLTRRLPGAGLFKGLHEDLILTWPGENRAIWQVPAWLFPQNRASTLSYHATPQRWQQRDGVVRLDSAKRGQEFVLDVEDYQEAIGWLVDLVTRHAC